MIKVISSKLFKSFVAKVVVASFLMSFASINGATAKDESMVNYFNKHRVTESMVNNLAKQVNRYGYGPISVHFTKYMWAVVITDTCIEVRQGKRSWAKEIATDIRDGGKRSNVQNFYKYVRGSFCPRLRY